MAEAFDHGLAGEESLVGVSSLAEGREHGGGVLAVLLRADGRAERVVEVARALRGSDRVAARPLAGPTGASLRSRLPFEA